MQRFGEDMTTVLRVENYNNLMLTNASTNRDIFYE